jgi:hypothetical protein
MYGYNSYEKKSKEAKEQQQEDGRRKNVYGYVRRKYHEISKRAKQNCSLAHEESCEPAKCLKAKTIAKKSCKFRRVSASRFALHTKRDEIGKRRELLICQEKSVINNIQ